MDEVELLDEALNGCSYLKQGIADLLSVLSNIKDEESASLNKIDTQSKNTKPSKKSKNKDKNKSVNNTKSTKKVAINIDKDNINAASTDLLGELNGVIVKVNNETVTKPKRKKNRSSKNKKTKGKKTKLSDNKIVNESTIQPHENIDSDEAFEMESLLELKSEITSNVFETDSIDFEISSDLRSLPEINSAYSRIDKRYIEVKRSLESVVFQMRHIDGIANRQKDVFHINFSCANNENFICHH